MDVVKVLAKLRDGVYGGIRNIAALGKDQVTKAGGNVDDFFHGGISKACAGSQVEDSEMFIGPHSLVGKI